MIAYLVTNKVNGKRYIGISSTSLKRRWYHHLTLARCGKRKSLMHLAIKKHGPDNFSIEEIACAKLSATRRGKPTGPRSAEAREKIRLGALRREAEKRKNRTQLEIFPTIDGQP